MDFPFKVFNIAFNRCGTTSLTAAMRILGFRSLHYRLGEQRIKHILSRNRAEQKPLLDGLDHYQFFADFTGHKFFRDLDAQVPGSKFILTVRDLESWLDSRVEHGMRRHRELRDQPEQTAAYREKRRGQYHAIVRETTEYFKERPADFLVLNICAGDGWDKLCRFLSQPIPAEPFPHQNQRKPVVEGRRTD